VVRAIVALVALVGVAALLNGCTTTRTQTPSFAADEAAIADFNKRYLKAINDGDIAALSSLTTDDHIMLAPGRPPIVGKAANDAANGRIFQQFTIDETWTPVETRVTGDWAYQRGTFTVAATPKAGGATRNSRGHFLRIYRRQPDNSWRMIRDMFNTDERETAN
jgi:uncharacterized protein (TIGR02246 family)